MSEWGVNWGPGWTYYRCFECGFQWTEASKFCQSLLGMQCKNCSEFADPTGFETHYEWPVDIYKNLLEKSE